MKLQELFTLFTVKDSQFVAAMNKNRQLAEKLKGNLDAVSRAARQSLFVLGGIGALTIKIASDAEESGSKFEAVFKEEARAAEKFADVLSKKVNRSVIDLKTSLAGIQDTFVPLGFARDKARELSQTMVELAVDVASFQNASDTDVIRDFTSALVGNTETVRKYGIIITQATLTQELQRQGLDKTATSATEMEKVQARLNLILAGTSDAQGDAARTGQSFANQMKGLIADSKDLAAAIGDILIPPVKSLIKRIREVLPELTEWIKKNKVLTGTLVATGGGILAFVGLLGPLLFGINQAVIFIGSLIGAFGVLKIFAIGAITKISTALKILKGLILTTSFTSLAAIASVIQVVGTVAAALGLAAFAYKRWLNFLDDTAAIEKATKAHNALLDAQIANIKFRDSIPDVPAGSKLVDGKIVKLKVSEDADAKRQAKEDKAIEKAFQKSTSLQFRQFEAANKTEEIENQRSLDDRLISIKKFVQERGRILEIRRTAARFALITEEGLSGEERRTKQIELDEDFARRAIQIKVEETRLFKEEEERKTRIAADELRKRLKAASESTKDLRKFERDLLKDEILAQRERKKAAAEDIKSERGRLSEAQKRAKESRISFTGVIQRLRQIQIGLGGEKENKLVAEAKKRLKVAQDMLEVQKEQLEELKNQLPLMGT